MRLLFRSIASLHGNEGQPGNCAPRGSGVSVTLSSPAALILRLLKAGGGANGARNPVAPTIFPFFWRLGRSHVEESRFRHWPLAIYGCAAPKCLSSKSRKIFQSSLVIECLPGRM